MNNLSTLPSLEFVIAKHGLATRKSLGQHFLLDSGITDKIALYAGNLKDHYVLEIGPGPGGLTRSLLAAGAKKLYVIEKDDRCIAIMEELQAVVGEQLEIIHEDALGFDAMSIPAPRKIVANLPYNVGTALLLEWLEMIYLNTLPLQGGGQGGGLLGSAKADPHPNLPSKKGEGINGAFTSLTLMFQKEVAQRIIAEPGNKDFGRLSVICQWLCECRYDFELPPEAFSPPPKVSSAVITLIPRAKPLVDVSKDALEKVVAKAFGQRRKMLRQALKGLSIPADELLAKAGIDGTLRAEQLDVVTLCKLAKTYSQF